MVDLKSNPQNIVQISNNMAKYYSDLACISATQAQNCLDTMLGLEANILQEMINQKIIITKVSELENDVGYLTSVPQGYVTYEELDSRGFLTFVPPGYITVEELEEKGYLTADELESKGYLTEHQDISSKADKSDTYTKAEIDSLIGNIDTLLDEIIGG